jgi:hypothetical protein
VRPAKIVVMHAMVVIFGPKWLRKPEPELGGCEETEE